MKIELQLLTMPLPAKERKQLKVELSVLRDQIEKQQKKLKLTERLRR